MSEHQEASSSSHGHILPKRRSVDEDAGLDAAIHSLPEGVLEKDLVRFTVEVDSEILLASRAEQQVVSPSGQLSPPPQYPTSETSASNSFRLPPPFSSLYEAPAPPEAASSVFEPLEPYKPSVTESEAVVRVGLDSSPSPLAAPAYVPSGQVVPGCSSSTAAAAASQFQDETKRALPQDTKGQASRSAKDDEAEPPPAYSEGSSPLLSFTYLMAAAGGASSIITQVQQGAPPINTLGGESLPNSSPSP